MIEILMLLACGGLLVCIGGAGLLYVAWLCMKAIARAEIRRKARRSG